MKKIVLTAIAAFSGILAFAQGDATPNGIIKSIPATAAKTTHTGDTSLVRRFFSTDTSILYVPDYAVPFDSGFVAGTNAYGDKSFAERFDYNGTDSAVRVLGAIAYFSGRATATSAKNIRVKAWYQGAPTTVSTKVYYNGFPTTSFDSLVVPIKNLRRSTGIIDTFATFWFPTQSPILTDSFFLGYSIDYTFSTLAGDTLGLVQTKNGNRHTPALYLKSNLDTVLNVQNATQFSDNSWHDNYWGNAPRLLNHYVIYAIIKTAYIAGIKEGISKNNLTFYGSYPNPATNETKVKIALKTATDVTVTIMDMSGRVVNTIAQNKLSAGEHEIAVNTTALASGVYTYLVRTNEGDGMASQFTIAK